MSSDADERAKGVDLPAWWLEKVRELVDERGENMTSLGRSLAKAVGRSSPWNHSVVSRFLRDINPTVPMAEAFAALLGIPRPFFMARSFDEALSLQQVARRYDEKLAGTSVQRLDAVDRLATAAERDAKDQSDRVPSDNAERAGRGGRTGRAHRGRSSAS